MKRLLLLVFLVFTSVCSHAVISTQPGYKLSSRTAVFPSPEAACLSVPSSGWTFDKAAPSGSSWLCYWRRNGDSTSNAYDIVISAGATCPANSSLVPGTGTCKCDASSVESAGACVPKTDPNARCAGDFVMSGFGVGMGTLGGSQTMQGVVPSGDMCWPNDSPTSGCTVTFNRDKVTAMTDGSVQSSGTISMYKGPSGSVQGKACTIETPSDGGTQVEDKCDKPGSYSDSKGAHSVCFDAPKCEGGFAGEVGGVEVCVKDKGSNVIETSKDTIKKNEDGSTDKVTEKTTCKGSSCTTEKTTTTTTNNNTSSSSTTTKTESKEDYCKANANASQCKDDDEEKGKFGGSCSAGFTCEGDPLQCAIAKDQHKRNCQMFEDKTPESQLYDAETAKGTSRDVTADLPGNREVDVSSDLRNEDVLGGGGRCISDLNVRVWVTEVSLPFSRICPSLDYLGWILVAVSSLIAFRIVSGSPKED